MSAYSQKLQYVSTNERLSVIAAHRVCERHAIARARPPNDQPGHPATAHLIAMPISEPVITLPGNERRSLLASNFVVVSADGISAQDLPDS
jgi:hypothetical protein